MIYYKYIFVLSKWEGNESGARIEWMGAFKREFVSTELRIGWRTGVSGHSTSDYWLW